jgi:hypothetical protein
MKYFKILWIVIVLFSCKKKEAINTDFENTKGCGGFGIYHKMDSTKLLNIYIDNKKTTFLTTFQVYEHIENEVFANISVEENEEVNVLFNNICNDVLTFPTTQIVLWKLSSGKLSYKVSEIPEQFNCNSIYRASILLQNAIFIKENSNEIYKIDSLDIKNVTVGICAG